jgi:hypothetical protein
MHKLEKPNIEGLDAPTLPMPWQWGDRMDLTTGFSLAAVMHNDLDQEQRKQLSEYKHRLFRRYLMPGHVGFVLNHAFRHGLEDELSSTLVTQESQNDYEGMMSRFETDYLSLPVRENGTRWWASAAGFSGGSYDAHDIGALYDMTGEELVKRISRDNKFSGWIVGRADNYLIPMTARTLDSPTVTIDGVKELTPEGEQFAEVVLHTYEQGLNFQKR